MLSIGSYAWLDSWWLAGPGEGARLGSCGRGENEKFGEKVRLKLLLFGTLRAFEVVGGVSGPVADTGWDSTGCGGVDDEAVAATVFIVGCGAGATKGVGADCVRGFGVFEVVSLRFLGGPLLV